MDTTKIRRAPARANKKPSANRTKAGASASPPRSPPRQRSKVSTAARVPARARAAAAKALPGSTRDEDVRERLRALHWSMGQLAERIRYLAGDLELDRSHRGMSLGQAFTEAMTEVWNLELALE